MLAAFALGVATTFAAPSCDIAGSWVLRDRITPSRTQTYDALDVAMEEADRHEAIVVAGPVVELLPLAEVFEMAARRLNSAGRLVGVIPCLRDNSPESQLFMDLAAEQLWPYCVAEELMETLEESGFELEGEGGGFAAVPQFVRAVIDDELAFKGFRKIFDEMEKQGYDPIEVGWGELRFSAKMKEADED